MNSTASICYGENPLVSIVVPMYNVSSYISDCINSIIQQTYTNIEVVLVDDCSTDNTVSICNEIVSSYDGTIAFRIIKHIVNQGLSSSRNTGIDCSKGLYLYFLDADDFLDNRAIDVLVSAIQRNPCCSIAVGYFSAYTKDVGKTVYRKDWLFTEERIIEPDQFANRMLTEKSNFAATAKLYNRSVVGSVRFQVGKKNEDTLFIVDLVQNILKDGIKCIDVPDYSYNYRMREGSISHSVTDPLEWNVIQNYEYAISKINDLDTIMWLKKKQLQLSLIVGNLIAHNVSIHSVSIMDISRFLGRYSFLFIINNLPCRDCFLYICQHLFPRTYVQSVRFKILFCNN